MNDDVSPVQDPARRRLLGTLAAAGLAGVMPRVRAKHSRPLGVALVGPGYDSRDLLAPGRGAMYDMGVHALNAARYTTGAQPVAVTATSSVERPEIFRGVDETMRSASNFRTA